MRQQIGVAPALAADPVLFGTAPRTLLQSALPFVIPPNSFMKNNGVVIIGQAPAASATASFSATSGSVTMTMSAATLLGTSGDVGRVLTILDTTYKFATITAFSSTTVATVTISGGTLSGTGPFANSAIWLTASATGTTGYSIPFQRAIGNSYSSFPAGAIQSGSAAGWYWTNWSSTTVGQVYNVTPYSSGAPAVQSSPPAFVSTGPGPFTQASAAYITGRNFVLPANLMGLNGSVEMQEFSSLSNTVANNKQVRAYIGTIATRFGRINGTTYLGGIVTLTNQGVTNSQMYSNATASGDFNVGTGANPVQTLAADTTTAQTIGEAIYLGVPTDWIIAERVSFKLYPSSP